MRVADVELSYPLLNYKAIVDFYTERNSTAIEWLILEVICKMEGAAAYANVSVETIFKGLFFIDNVDELLKPCLLSLADMGAVRLEGVDNDTPLKDIMCNQLHMTNMGRELQNKGILPGVENDTAINLFYNLFDREIEVEFYKEPSTESKGLMVMAMPEDITADFPAETIKEYLEQHRFQQKKERFGWLQSGTHIGAIRLYAAAPAWKNIKRPLLVGKDMEIAVEGADIDILERVLEDTSRFPAFDEADKLLPLVCKDPDKELKDIFTVDQLQVRLTSRMRDSKICLVEHRFNQMSNTSELSKNKGIKVAVIFGNETTKPYIEINDQMIKAYIPEQVLEPGAIYKDEEQEIRLGNMCLKSGEKQEWKSLCIVPKETERTLQDVLISAIKAHYSENIHAVILLLETGMENQIAEFVEQYLTKKKDLASLAASVAELNKIGEKYCKKALVGKELQQRIFVTDVVERLAGIPLHDIPVLLEELNGIGIYRKNEELYASLVAGVLNSADEDFDLESVWAVWDKLKKVRGACLKNLINTREYQRLYNSDVLKQFLLEFRRDDFLKSPEYTPVESLFLKLKRMELQLKDLILGLTWSDDCSDEKVRTCILENRDNLSAIYDRVKVWNDTVLEVGEKFQNVNGIVENDCYFVQCQRMIARIADALSIFFDAPTLKYNSIYVVDTCAIMNHPEIVSMFESGKSMLVIPIVVLQELDNHKERSRDESKCFKAREAIREIHKYQGEPWLNTQEESNNKLLPADLSGQSNDNKIISVALKLIVKRPTIISDDTNFRNTAASVRIQAISSQAFLTDGVKGSAKSKKQSGKSGKKR